MNCNSIKMQIVHEDRDFIVVDKASGFLSVPGRGPEKFDCVTTRIRRLYPDCIDHPEVHRLDMDTSGLIVVALDPKAHRDLSAQFRDREVSKQYIALLDGELAERKGTIELRTRLDLDDRPKQICDDLHGKLGTTHWKRLAASGGYTRIAFRPITGRRHQLRVHAAHSRGLEIPIVGDPLYCSGQGPGELKLHASELEFRRPGMRERVRFLSAAPF